MSISLSVSSFSSYTDTTKLNHSSSLDSFFSQIMIPVAEYSGNSGLLTSNSLTLWDFP